VSKKITTPVIILHAIILVAFLFINSGSTNKNSAVANKITVTQPSAGSVKPDSLKWMPNNLNVSKFRNGDPVPEVKTEEEWEKAGNNKQPAWCYYNNDAKNGKKHGRLYNWYAVNDSRGLAPEGWHIASDKEWNNFPGNCIAGGLRDYENSFSKIDTIGFWWTATVARPGEAWAYYLIPHLGYVRRLDHNCRLGLSVRCIKN
jgi:hypothetical protein